MVLEYWYLKRDIGSGKVLSKLFKCLLGLYVAGPCATIFCQTAQVLRQYAFFRSRRHCRAVHSKARQREGRLHEEMKPEARSDSIPRALRKKLWRLRTTFGGVDGERESVEKGRAKTDASPSPRQHPGMRRLDPFGSYCKKPLPVMLHFAT